MKKDFIMPILVLALICLCMTGLLALVNNLTFPIIEEAAAERAELAMKEIIPEADEFELLSVDGLPLSVLEVYSTSNDVGYIFVVSNRGYGGHMTVMCGLSPDGTIIRSLTLSHSETKGISDAVFHMFDNNHMHKDMNWQAFDSIEAVSGATISSEAYMRSIRDAFEAFKNMRGLQ
jgi:electron transport complex protein RnfG